MLIKRLRARIAALSSSSCTDVRVAHRRLALHPSRQGNLRFSKFNFTVSRAATTALALLACASLLVASAQARHDGGIPHAGLSLLPPPALQLDGVPAISQALADDIEPYGEFFPTRFSGWHPTEEDMLIVRRADNVAQLFLLTAPLAKPQQLTKGKEPIRDAMFEPKRGAYVLFARDQGGDEATQIFRLDPKTLEEKQVTPNGELHSLGPWNSARDKVIVTSSPLDRVVKRDRAYLDVYAINPLQPEARFKLTTLQGAGWSVLKWLDRDNRLIVRETLSDANSTVWSLDLATGKRSKVDSGFAFDEDQSGDRWVYRRMVDEDFVKLSRTDLRTGDREWITKKFPHDIDTWSVSKANGRVAVLVNVNGLAQLKLFNEDLTVLPTPKLPPGLITSVAWHRNGRDLALTIESADSPGEVFSVDVDTQQVLRWTQHSSVADVDRPFAEASPITWKSFDGTTITGLIHKPPRSLPRPPLAKFPVIINIHGGPASQSRPGFRGRTNYWISERGVAVIYPNVRGSSGFGKKFLQADNGAKREDAVKDIGALLDWIQTQPDLDASRVALMGGSYGGYVVLAASARYANRIAAAYSSVGISHFVSFLENTETYRRDLRRSEYGDERDPETRRFLDSISPLTHADKIKVPLLVSHGKNDPRVNYTEAEQIVKKVRASGTPVWYVLAEDEGHGFAKQTNAEFQFATTTAFFDRYLLRRGPNISR
jgi:dipeptidyl aminopeptidase/acylaminoacyl peptidase